MIRNAAGPSAASLDKNSFQDMMLPFMQEELYSQEESVEEMRAKFLEADADGSGFLSVDELWSAIRKMGADVELDDIVNLMSEIDVDRDG